MAGLALWSANRGDFALDSAAKQQLAGYKLRAAVQSDRLTATAISAAVKLHGIGIEAAVFKGIATESRFYPEPGTRPAADVDLFIDPAAHHRLNEIIDLFQPAHALSGAAQRLHDLGRMQGFDVLHKDIWVDMHTDPIKVGVPIPGLGELWRRTEVVDLGGVPCRVLDTEASILQAIVHLQKDRFSELHGFTDVARMAAGDVDWDWLQSFAAAGGLAVHLNEGLRVVSDVLDVDLPFDSRFSSRVWKRLWPEDSRLRGKAGKTRKVRTHYWIPFTMKGRRREAFRWWRGIVLPAPEMIDYLHPEATGPYLWRLASYRGRLAWERHRRNVQQRREGSLAD
jgi:hypothetical protein